MVGLAGSLPGTLSGSGNDDNSVKSWQMWGGAGTQCLTIAALEEWGKTFGFPSSGGDRKVSGFEKRVYWDKPVLRCGTVQSRSGCQSQTGDTPSRELDRSL
ncbi:MAG: hypothetical protein WBF52_14340 [Geitlerinemataceae cyanobacterium]